VEEDKTPSDPPARQYDRAACWTGCERMQVAKAADIREVRDAGVRNRRAWAPGDRH
jgi:hypothetical protein